MQIVEGLNFRDKYPGVDFSLPGRLGIVRDTRFVRCYWPALDAPCALFADGSGGIEVQGPPTPRNIVFPPGTRFLPVIVNDAKLGEKPRWRVTEIPTKGDSFFIRTRRIADVIEAQEVEREVILASGDSRRFLAKVTEEMVVQREVEHVEHMTVAEALAFVGR